MSDYNTNTIACAKTNLDIADSLEALVAGIRAGKIRRYRRAGLFAGAGESGPLDTATQEHNKTVLESWNVSHATVASIVAGKTSLEEATTGKAKPKAKAKAKAKPKAKAKASAPATPDTSAPATPDDYDPDKAGVVTAQSTDDEIKEWSMYRFPVPAGMQGLPTDAIKLAAEGGNALAREALNVERYRAQWVRRALEERAEYRAAAARAESERYREQRREQHRAERDQRAISSSAPTAESFTVKAAHLAIAARYAQVSLAGGQTVKIGKKAAVGAGAATVLEGDLEVLALLGLVAVGGRVVTRLQD